MFGVHLDRLDDQVQFVRTVDLSRHAVVLAWRDLLGFGEVIQAVDPAGRVALHKERHRFGNSVRESKSRWLVLKLNVARGKQKLHGRTEIQTEDTQGFLADSQGFASKILRN